MTGFGRQQRLPRRTARERRNAARMMLAGQVGDGLIVNSLGQLDLYINGLSVATIAAGDFVPFWDITATAANKKITFANFEGTLSHDSLADYVVAEHVDWAGASAGTIHTDNYIEGGAGTDTTAIHDNTAGEINAVTPKTTPVGADLVLIEDSAASFAKKELSITNLSKAIDHDTTTNFVLDEHIAHSGVDFSAGVGISGGGDISANRSFALDILGLTTDTIAAGDWVPFHDLTDAPNKITFANFESTLNHDSLSGYVGNEHIDWTGASENLSTAGSGTFGSLIVDTNTLVVNLSGYTDRVGINTVTPAYTLDVTSGDTDVAIVRGRMFIGAGTPSFLSECTVSRDGDTYLSWVATQTGGGAFIEHSGSGEFYLDSVLGTLRFRTQASKSVEFYANTSGGGGLGLKLASNLSVVMPNDGADFSWGAASDASIQYTGSVFRIRPDRVGTGYVHIYTGQPLALVIGKGSIGIDYQIKFDGQNTDGYLTWMEDEDYFKFEDDILMPTAEKHYFRDVALGIYSQADTFLDFFADGAIRFGDSSAGAPTNYMNVSATALTTWVGTAGLVMGSMYVPGVDIDVDIVNADPTEVADGDGDGWSAGELNGMTFPTSGTEHYLTVTVAGKYEITWSLALHSDAGGDELHGGVMVDDTPVRNNGEAHCKVLNVNDSKTIGSPCIADLPSGDEEISLWVSSDGGDDIHIEYGTVTAVLIGGT